MTNEEHGITPEAEAPPSRAEVLREQFDALENEPAPAAKEVQPPAEAAPETAQPEKVDGRKTRPHAPDGKFLPASRKPEPAAAAAKPASPTQNQPQAATPLPAAEPAKAIQRPSTWKKDHWQAFDKIATENPALAQYILERESQYAGGVSTYKNEFEKVKPLSEAVAPYRDILAQHGIEPAQHIQRLFGAHQMLATGTPEQRLGMFIKLAQDYKVPVQQLFQQGQDGAIYFNQQALQQQVPPAQPQYQQQPQPDVRNVVKELLMEEAALSEAQRMAADTENYPHFEELRETMSGLLQAGLAADLPSAYAAAMRHPQHDNLFQAMQQQQREQEEARQRQEVAARAATARRNAFSPRTATPTGTAPAGNGKDRRSVLSEAFDGIGGGRV